MTEVKHTEHIIIRNLNNGHTEVEIRDRELYDFIEDVLVEKFDIEYESVNFRNENGKEVIAITIFQDYPFEKIVEVIQSIEPEEIRRIYSLNN